MGSLKDAPYELIECMHATHSPQWHPRQQFQRHTDDAGLLASDDAGLLASDDAGILA
jgi:hypothetical protein